MWEAKEEVALFKCHLADPIVIPLKRERKVSPLKPMICSEVVKNSSADCQRSSVVKNAKDGRLLFNGIFFFCFALLHLKPLYLKRKRATWQDDAWRVTRADLALAGYGPMDTHILRMCATDEENTKKKKSRRAENHLSFLFFFAGRGVKQT